MPRHTTIIIGAGPAGLTAAYELARNGVESLVLERGEKVGGLARTEEYKGFRIDIGGHRFFTKVEEIHDLWTRVLGTDFRTVRRLSRIYYDQRFFSYPLSVSNLLKNLGITEGLRIFASYCKARIHPHPVEDSFEQWVTNRFGERLYRTFFKTYTEKVWGIPCSEIRADWAVQRIKGLSLFKALTNALFSTGDAKTLIRQFHYPRLGPGQMWERFRSEVEKAGGQVKLSSSALRVHREGYRIHSVSAKDGESIRRFEADQFLSSMPLSQLILRLDPEPPPEVLESAQSLKYRDFIIVVLILNRRDVFPDNWIYVHSGRVRVGRIQNFKNWSSDMVTDREKTSLGMEYFCFHGDGLWEMTDVALIDLASREIEHLGLADADLVSDACVIRQPGAYPVYDGHYREHLKVLREFLSRFSNLQTVGRNGMHRYNNQDHSMLCGLYAARNILGGNYDLWEVNTERSYQEEYEMTRDSGPE